jgi:hypothetical protein
LTTKQQASRYKRHKLVAPHAVEPLEYAEYRRAPLQDPTYT